MRPIFVSRSLVGLFLAALLLLLFMLWGCCAPSLELSQTDPADDPPARLNSPLLACAEVLKQSDPRQNYLSLLEIGSDALLARIHLIRSAKSSISVQTMIWANDETGRLVMYELLQAARRGVKVRLLIDHLASEQHIEIATFLADAHPNLQIKLYNPIAGVLGKRKADPSLLDKFYAMLFSFKRLNQRMHNKTFIVDRLVAITGGRNYQNAYYDQARGMNYKDRDVMVVGPVAGDMQDSFNRYWAYRRAIALADLADVKKQRKQGKRAQWHTRESFRLNGLFTPLLTDVDRSELISRLFVEPLKAVADVEFIADDPQKRGRFLFSSENRSKITLKLAELASNAERSVNIQTPYLVLTSRAIDLFQTLRQKYPGIDLRISTNSLAATDSWYVYALSYKQKQTYLTALKFKIFEFKPLPADMLSFMPSYEQLMSRSLTPAERHEISKTVMELRGTEDDSALPPEPWAPAPDDGQPYFCLHAKSMVVDGEFSFVGSYNLDPRSENINTECGLVIRDRSFAATLQGYIADDMQAQNSWVIAPKKRPLGLHVSNAILAELSHLLPLVDVWPFRYSASFELISGKPAVDVEDEDFYENYRDVGSFPQVTNQQLEKQVGARGTKAFLSIVKPLL
ncbi:MAG: phospholipase D family protein [Desulfuromonadales bacterium]|nr:phospholipase D family protein [Desulfuromonadales bacterium]